MYTQFFGFKERPFKLVPDPDYLFLGKTHEEALAHLRYAVGQGEGFVEIIGEIGTGKTMLCRTFLEGLGPDVESAYIFNPRMDALDLLKAVNDEFGISAAHDSIKALVDELNTFLIEKKAAGRSVVLVIDEAQNLSRDVLEQIRLLSNLETTKDKLLQIVLAGQPELGVMLDSYDLRQLRQRISLSCRLSPLTYAETKAYIAHRVGVAALKPMTVFSRAATGRIYKFSGGIPRLINMACDRSLVTAFARNRLKVSGGMAKSAIRELSCRSEIHKKRSIKQAPGLIAASVAMVVVLAGAFLFFNPDPGGVTQNVSSELTLASEETKAASTLSLPETAGQSPPAQEQAARDDSAQLNADIPDETPAVVFQDFLAENAGLLSRRTAVERILKQWEITGRLLADVSEPMDDLAFFSMAANRQGLTATPVNQDFHQMIRLNLPAVLTFHHPSVEAPLYLTAVRALPAAMVFSAGEEGAEVEVPYDQVVKYWSGDAVVFWKNFYHYRGTIPIDAPGESVITLKLHLRDMGFSHIEISGTYDPATRWAVQAIQARHGIPVDGVVGPLTKIVLYNEKSSLPIPHLWDQINIPDKLPAFEMLENDVDQTLSHPALRPE